jgi:murein DD-endopeptidase MepM/ murein hydrolase activator NlpD
MFTLKRCFVMAASGALLMAVGSVPVAARRADGPAVATLEAVQGTVVRWSVPGTKRCGMGGRSWAALQETCYYPIDMLRTPGLVKVSRRGVGPAQFAHISVGASSYGTRDVELGDIPQANPSPADLRRNTRDQARLAKVWAKPEGPARFTLPLGAPATPLPEGQGFGAKWIFDGKPDKSEIHSGVDYALTTGTPLSALADGTVVIAEDLFFTGNAVFIDHGNGLVSMYFHLSEIKVQAGQDVKKGEILGLVGDTGRASGPHMHVGVRWHDARIGPQALLDDPAKIPAFANE